MIGNSTNRLHGRIFRLSLLSITALTSLALPIAAPAQAEEILLEAEGDTAPSDTTELQTLNVVGNRLGTTDPAIVEEHQGARHVVRSQEIEESGATSIKEAIRRVPGVQVPENNGTGSGDFALNIGMRGLGSRLTSRATVLLDGVPLANAPYGQPQTSLAPIALGNLEAIDVIKGGSAVRYGPQNVGGVINFVTKEIPDEFEVSGKAGGEFYGGGSDQTGRGTADLSIGGTADNGLGLALLYSGTHGQGFRENDEQALDDVLLKYEIPAGENARVEGRLHHFQSKNDLPGPLTFAEFDDDPFGSTHSYEEFDGDRQEVTAKYINSFDGTLELEIGGFITDSFREFTLANGNDSNLTRLDRLPRRYRVYGTESRLSGLASTGPVDHEWSVGYRLIREKGTEKRFRRSGFGAGGDPFSVDEANNRHTVGRTLAHAVYVDNRMDWGDFSITPGVRFESVRTERHNELTGFTDKEKYNEVLPSLNIGYQVTDDVLLYANYSESFGAVGFMALSTGTDSSLEPERSETYEIGTRFEHNGLTGDATLFWIDFDNQIEYDSTAGVNVNRGATRHRGIETALSYDLGTLDQRFEGLSVYGGYAYTQAKLREGEFKGNDLALYSRHTGSVGARYEVDDWTFNLDGYAQSRQYADDENTRAKSADGSTGIIPGFAYWNVRANHRLDLNGTELDLSLGVKNLFDRGYYTRASIENNSGIYAGTPRTFYVQAKATF